MNRKKCEERPKQQLFLSRRSCLKLATAIAAPAVGYSEQAAAGVETTSLPVKYGYGGAPTLARTGFTAYQIAESEPNDGRGNATDIDTNAEVTGELAPGDIDWYAFDATENERYTVEFGRLNDTGVSALVLYGPNGDSLDSRYVKGDTPASIVEVAERSGTYYVQVVNVENGAGSYTLTVETQSPYGGSAWSLPGRIQAEDFDEGGEGVAYRDTNAENEGGRYRPSSGVDIQDADDTGDGYNVGWMRDGEWLEYTVDVPAGTYDVDARIAAPRDSGQLRMMLDETTLGTIDVPVTGGWQDWRTVTLEGVSVSGSARVLRLEIIGGSFNLNWIEFGPANDRSAPEIEFGKQGYGEQGYGGIEAES
jgi:uncharacterized protein involved in high-affinity Fe2+ transport